MQKLVMEKHSQFSTKIDEINRVLKDGWDIFEGPFVVGEYICLKLVKYDYKDDKCASDMPSGLLQFEDEDS